MLHNDINTLRKAINKYQSDGKDITDFKDDHPLKDVIMYKKGGNIQRKEILKIIQNIDENRKSIICNLKMC